MVFSLAPKASSRSRLQISKTAVSAAATASSKVKQPAMVRSAFSFWPLPMKMDARGAPPPPASAAKADTIIMSGIHTPTPVSARLPTSGIWPIYIRSTMLYSILISWATTVGTASRNSSFPTGAVPRSAFLSIRFPPYTYHFSIVYHFSCFCQQKSLFLQQKLRFSCLRYIGCFFHEDMVLFG